MWTKKKEELITENNKMKQLMFYPILGGLWVHFLNSGSQQSASACATVVITRWGTFRLSEPCCLNPLNPIGDQDRISPYSVNTISTR